MSFNEKINGNVPVLVDFYAEWCGPCKTMAPVLSELAGEYKGRVHILKVDVDKNPAAASKYKIRGVPTLMIFKNGKILWQQSGAMPKHALAGAINSVLAHR